VKKFYHITLKKKLNSIMKNGLIPQIGPRSKWAEDEFGIFLFPSIDDMNNALDQWFGDLFLENTILMSLEITIPDDFPIFDSIVEYEKISKIVIPPEYIRYIQDE